MGAVLCFPAGQPNRRNPMPLYQFVQGRLDFDLSFLKESFSCRHFTFFLLKQEGGPYWLYSKWLKKAPNLPDSLIRTHFWRQCPARNQTGITCFLLVINLPFTQFVHGPVPPEIWALDAAFYIKPEHDHLCTYTISPMEPDVLNWIGESLWLLTTKKTALYCTTRNTIIWYVLSKVVYLELLLDHISTTVHNMNHCY
jgi:hypothetical protein